MHFCAIHVISAFIDLCVRPQIVNQGKRQFANFVVIVLVARFP